MRSVPDPALHLMQATFLLTVITGCHPRASGPVDARAGAHSPETMSPLQGATRSRSKRPTVDRALEVVRDHYAAINAGDFARAYAAWRGGTPPGDGSFAAFRRRFDDVASTDAILGEPGRVEGAAGSRYLVVPVTIVVERRDGDTMYRQGSYTLRRAVVSGASPRDRRWHLYRESLTPATEGR